MKLPVGTTYPPNQVSPSISSHNLSDNIQELESNDLKIEQSASFNTSPKPTINATLTHTLLRSSSSIIFARIVGGIGIVSIIVALGLLIGIGKSSLIATIAANILLILSVIAIFLSICVSIKKRKEAQEKKIIKPEALEIEEDKNAEKRKEAKIQEIEQAEKEEEEQARKRVELQETSKILEIEQKKIEEEKIEEEKKEARRKKEKIQEEKKAERKAKLEKMPREERNVREESRLYKADYCHFQARSCIEKNIEDALALEKKLREIITNDNSEGDRLLWAFTAISEIPNHKSKELSYLIQEAVKDLPKSGPPGSIPSLEVIEKSKRLQSIYDKFNQFIEDEERDELYPKKYTGSPYY